MKFNKLPLIIKIVLYHGIFILLHYLYDWFPNALTVLISGINESVYQHMKIGFFTYLLLILIEYLLIRQKITSTDRYIYARLFTATYLPLVMMVIYLLGPLLFGHFEKMAAEIIFANLALLLTSLSAFIVEEHVEKAKPGLAFRVVLIVLFAMSFAQFIVFTFRVPWFDIFAIPPGY